MQNYGEELAYWYFRFNGFFILTDFIIHQFNGNSPSDVDLLAVKFPFVEEGIDNQILRLDDELFNNFHNNNIIGIICEVKTGGGSANQLNNEEKILRSLRRFGFIQDYTPYLSQVLEEPVCLVNNKYEIGKVFIADRESQQSSCINISLSKITDFIKQRIDYYIKYKFRDRTHFPSSLLQYIIWEEHSTE